MRRSTLAVGAVVAFFGLLFSGLPGSRVEAATITTISVTNFGRWSESGHSQTFNSNSLAGFLVGGPNEGVNRDYFVFDLSSVHGPVIGATLRIFDNLNGPSSPDPTETIAFYDVSTPIPALIADGTGPTAIFDDLGTGQTFGSQVVVTNGFGGITYEIELNSSALAAINSSLGTLFAIGGAVTTLSGQTAVDEFVFGASGGQSCPRPEIHEHPCTKELVLVTPEPATLLLLGAGLAGMAGFVWRRHRRK